MDIQIFYHENKMIKPMRPCQFLIASSIDEFYISIYCESLVTEVVKLKHSTSSCVAIFSSEGRGHDLY